MHRDPWYFEKKITTKGLELWHKEVPDLSWYGIGVVIYAGHRHDPRNLNNLSHLLEHAIIDSEKPNWKTRGEREEYMLSHGIIEGLGFTTSIDSMWTSIKTPRAAAGLSYLHDIFRIAPTEIDVQKPKRIVEREKKERGTEDERTIARAIMTAILPPDHALVRYHDSASLAHMFENATKDDLLDHWRNRYTTANTILITTGPLSTEEMAQLVDSHYAVEGDTVAVGTRDEVRALSKEELPPPERIRMNLKEVLGHEHYDRNIPPEVMIAYAHELPHLSNAERYLMRRTLSSSLFERLREQRHLVYSTPVRNELFADIGLHKINMNCSAENIEQILTETDNIVQIIQEEGPAIFEREKREALLSFEVGEETRSSVLHDMMHHIGAHGKTELKMEYLEKLQEITFEQILALTRECFGKGRATVIAITP